MVSLKKFLAPLKVTSKYMTKKPFTVMYPKEGPVQSKNYKGLHILDFNKCIGCGQCALVCPNECIEYIIPEDVDINDRKKSMTLRRPAVDWSHCIFCGLCVDICPVNTWKMESEFRIYGDATDRLDLIATPFEISTDEEIEWKTQRGDYVTKLSKKEVVEEIKKDPIKKIHYLMQTDLIAKAIGGHWEPILRELGKKWRDLRTKFFKGEITEEEWKKKSREIEEAVYSIIKASSVG